jgi:excisionase family DNA binding protein
MTDRLVMTVTEAAKALGMSKNTLYDLIRDDRFPHVRIGQRIRIPIQALHEWIHDYTSGSTR